MATGVNRFSGFQHRDETVETVLRFRSAQDTPLKQGVNEKNPLSIAKFVKHSS
jgi:hypothetical protein